MNKKFLSAILFGALMVTSTGTFVSCKDYDDDIENLQGQISANASAIAELKTLIQNGDYVTNVAVSGQNLVVTFKNAGPQTIALPACEGEGGSLAEVKGNQLFIDGEATGLYGESVKIVDGEWALLQDGDYVSTGIPVSGVTVTGDEQTGYTLTVTDAEGAATTIKLPTAASSIIDFELLGYRNANGTKENGFVPMHEADAYVAYTGYRVANSDLMKGWKGNKTKLVKDDVTVAYDTKGLVMRVAPSNVDATALSLSLVNSKGTAAPVDVVLSAYNNGGAALTRAASANNLYSVALKCQILKDTPANWNTKYYGYSSTNGSNTAAGSILYGVKDASGLTSAFDIAFGLVSHTINVDKVYLTNTSTWYPTVDVTSYTSANPYSIDATKTYSVSLADAAYIYDAYLEFTEDQALYWQVSYDKANSPMSFSVQRMPDSQTPAPLKVRVHYAQLDGVCSHKDIYVSPKTNLDAAKLSEEVKHNIVAYDATDLNKNAVTVSLDNMVTALGNDAYIAWKADADLDNTITNGIAIKTTDGYYTPINDTYDVKFLKADGTVTTTASEAKSVRFTFKNTAPIDLTKGYNVYIDFVSNKANKYYQDVVNKVYFPVSFAIPAFEDLLVKDMNVFDAEGKVASAYMLEAYDYNNGTATSTYKFNGAFENLADNVAKGFNFTFKLKTDDEPVSGMASDDLALIADAAYNTTATTSCAVTKTNANYVAITLRNAYAGDAYGKALTVNVMNPTYVGVYKYDNTSFKIKVLSPIKEGKFVTNGNAISLTSTGTTVITAEDVWATTVNDAVKYDLFKTAIKQTTGGYVGTGWKRQDIKGVKFSSDGIKFIVETAKGEPTAAVVDATTGAIKEASSISLRAVGNKGDRSKLTIQVTDIWGYTISKDVDVVVE